MIIPTWFLFICYGLGAIFLISAIYTMWTGNLVLLGKLRHSVTNNKKAVKSLVIYLVITAIVVSSLPLVAESFEKATSYVFMIYLLFTIVYWYSFQSKWVGPIGGKK